MHDVLLYHFISSTMLSQYGKIKSTLDYASVLHRVDKSLLKKFYDRLKQGSLVRDENPNDHFITFFIPFIQKTKQIFMGDHIKSGLWLVPGGHIDTGESPEETVVREINEKLNMSVTKNKIEFFDLSITDINSTYPCKRHYDFWYLYPLDTAIPFNYTKNEYETACWV